MTRMIFILLLAGLHTGCAALMGGLIEKPGVELESIQLQNPGLSGGTLLVALAIDNPNPVGGRIRSLTYDLKLNGAPFTKGTFEKGVTLKPNGREVVEIPLELRFVEVFETLRDALSKEEVKVRVRGKLTVGPFAIPYDFSGAVPVPKVPKVALDSVEIERLGITGARLVAALTIDNPNDFGVDLAGIDYRLALGGRELAGGTTGAQAIAAGASSRIELPVEVSFAQVGMAAYNLLKSAEVDYALSGALRVAAPVAGEQKLEFLREGEIPLKR